MTDADTLDRDASGHDTADHDTADPDAPAVGYMSPPKHTQFRKGKSGNPRGRPPKVKDIDTVLLQVVERKVGGGDGKMPIREALIRKLRELALKGDKQALALQRQIIDESGLVRTGAYDPVTERERVLRAFEAMGVKIRRTGNDL